MAQVIAQVIEIVQRPGSIEIRFGRRLAWWRRWVQAWREDRQALRLAELDERILKDIGLESCYRQQELRRFMMSRQGLI